jgi:hypothetical protein
MLTTRKAVNRRARYAVRVATQSRPRGRRRGYDNHVNEACEYHRKSGPPAVAAVMLAGVFLFLVCVVLGAMQPANGPLTKTEPVSTTQVRR